MNWILTIFCAICSLLLQGLYLLDSEVFLWSCKKGNEKRLRRSHHWEKSVDTQHRRRVEPALVLPRVPPGHGLWCAYPGNGLSWQGYNSLSFLPVWSWADMQAQISSRWPVTCSHCLPCKFFFPPPLVLRSRWVLSAHELRWRMSFRDPRECPVMNIYPSILLPTHCKYISNLEGCCSEVKLNRRTGGASEKKASDFGEMPR